MSTDGELMWPAPTVAPIDSGSTPPPRRSRWIVVGAIVVVLGLIGGAIGAGILDSRSKYPAKWDARFGDLPQTVSRLRGLKFLHPVPVRFLSEAAFKRETAVDTKGHPSAKREAEKLAASLRAAGLLSGKVDLVKAINDEQQSSVLAFYSPDNKEVVVRGTGPLDPAHRVTLAHELTHVLQDQHFDLNKLETKVGRDPEASSDAFRAFVEGDAVRIEDAYVKKLSAADRRSYQAEDAKGSAQADKQTAKVPAIITLQFSAPYRYGPPVLKVLLADGGNANVDRAFTHGVFTQELFIEPSAPLSESKPRKVADPKLASGEHALGKTDSFGAYDLYLLLASRIAPSSSLGSASNWAGGRMRTLRSRGRTCISGVVETGGRSNDDALALNLAAWAGALPSGMATVGRRGNAVTFHSCDPGAKSALTSPDAAIEQAGNLLDLHSGLEGEIVADFVKNGQPISEASCLALGIARSPQVAVLLLLPDAEVTDKKVQDAVGAAADVVGPHCVKQ